MILCATPYAYGVPFFYFETLEEYNEKYQKQFEKYQCEEYEFQFIDGDNIESILYEACKDNIFKLLEIIEEGTITTEEDAIKLYVCTNINGDSLEDALSRYQDIYLYHGSMKDYAYETFPWEQIPEWAHTYIDIDQRVTDLQCNGDLYELDGDFSGWCVIR
tara:strand:+ start:800 stop:1282 length:483 start_codon:yes stop_codon:yes gene_type:complete